MRAPLADEVCETCGAVLRDTGDEMRCPACYPFSYAEEEALMHSELKPWLKHRLEQQADGVDLRTLAEEAANVFLSDPTFLRTTVTALIRAAAREEAQRIIRSKRSGSTTVMLGDVVTSRADLEKRARSSALWGWMEQVGERRIRLPDLTREDLLQAARERQVRAGRELIIARFWEKLAGQLEEGQTIAGRFSAEEVEQLTKEREELEANQKRTPALREGIA